MTKTSKRLTTSTPVQGNAPHKGTVAGLAASSVTRPHAPLRRAVLSGVASTVALVTGFGAAADAFPDSLDAQLISLCTDLDAMERRIGVLFDFELSHPIDPTLQAAEAAAYLIDLDQRLILDRICGLAPTTLAGCVALAGSLALISPSLANAPAEAAVEERLTSTLLRGLRRGA